MYRLALSLGGCSTRPHAFVSSESCIAIFPTIEMCLDRYDDVSSYAVDERASDLEALAPNF